MGEANDHYNYHREVGDYTVPPLEQPTHAGKPFKNQEYLLSRGMQAKRQCKPSKKQKKEKWTAGNLKMLAGGGARPSRAAKDVASVRMTLDEDVERGGDDLDLDLEEDVYVPPVEVEVDHEDVLGDDEEDDFGEDEDDYLQAEVKIEPYDDAVDLGDFEEEDE